MKDDKDTQRDHQDNILHIDEYREVSGETTDSLKELLVHMRRVRETIPVNEKLREELRHRLLQHKAHLNGNAAGLPPGIPPLSTPAIMGPGKKLRFMPLLAAALLLLSIAAVALTLRPGTEKVLETGEQQVLTGFWADNEQMVPTLRGEGQAIVVARKGSLLLIDNNGNQNGIIKAPEGLDYNHPCWSPDGNEMALVRSGAGIQEIILAELPRQENNENLESLLTRGLATPRDIYEIKEGQVTGILWSPRGNTLAYTLMNTGGGHEVWLMEIGGETKRLGPGSNPAWSPDGAEIIIQRPGEKSTLWLVNISSGEASLLGEGQEPAWGSRGYIAYAEVKNYERVLSYLPDGSPQFSVLKSSMEIRSLYAGNNGSALLDKLKNKNLQDYGDLLYAVENAPGPAELEWLRNMELSGIREPRTLTIDNSSNIQSIKFDPGGSNMLVVRKDGTILHLLKISLREGMVKRGDTN